MTWAELHSESERIAIEAQLALRARNAGQAIELYRRAAEIERRALDQLDVSKTRTRGITAVSAVALWFKAGEYVLAEQLAHSMLADQHIPDFSREELRNLVQAIWTESSMRKAGVAFVPGQVMVSVKGGEVVTGGAPLDLIVDKVQTIQSIFYRTIEFMNGVSPAELVGRQKIYKRLAGLGCSSWLQVAISSRSQSKSLHKPISSSKTSNQNESHSIFWKSLAPR